MFDGLLKTKFYTKSKSAIKLTKTRIEMIKRKRNAMQKYLKNDIVDLLKNGLDTNSYGRVEGLWNEMNLSSCYDLVEQFCVHISSNLATMDKQRECPEECREAVSSVMFAAARFSDLPELRELRTLFTERYGNSIECYANKEFVNKLKSTPPTKDMKLQLIQDIAESCTEWDSKTLEQKLYNLRASVQERTNNVNADVCNIPKTTGDAVQKIDNKSAKYKHDDPMECASPLGEGEYQSSYGRKEVTGDESILRMRKSPFVAEGKKQTHLSYEAPENTNHIKDIQVDRVDRKEQQNEPHNIRRTSGEEHDDEKPFYLKAIRPPYYKSKNNMNSISNVPPKSTETEGPEHVNTKGHMGREDLQKVDPVGETKPKPKSVRRNRKQQQDHDKMDSSQSENKCSSGINQVVQKQGRQHRKALNDENHDRQDEEERIMNTLLMHYSRKNSPSEKGKSGGNLEPPPQQPPPSRTTSLPTELNSSEATKGHARACSFQPEMLNTNGHIHPKLPDYEDFLARLAALRKN